MTDGNLTYRDGYFVMYRTIESLCCPLGTNKVLKVNYISIFFLKRKFTNMWRQITMHRHYQLGAVPGGVGGDTWGRDAMGTSKWVPVSLKIRDSGRLPRESHI